MTETIFISIIPAALIVLGGMLILRKGTVRISSQPFLFYLLFIGMLLMSVVFGIELISPEHDTRLTDQISVLATPTMIGVLALVLINLRQLTELKTSQKLIVVLLGLILLGLLVASVWMQPFGTAQLILLGALVLAVVWVFAGKFDALGVTLSLVALILMALFNTDYLDDLSSLPEWLRFVAGVLMFSLPGLVVALVAVWVTKAPKSFSNRNEIEGTNKAIALWFPGVLRFGAAALLLGYLAYTIFWASVWDQTSDGLGGVMFSMWASLAAIAAGMLMGITATGWRKSAGLLFALVVPALMFDAFWLGWDVSYHAITEDRASRIQGAIESFYTDNGRYPTDLNELIPAHLLWIPEPVILRGEDWCYQGGQDYYRLGAFYREYFGTPLSLREYASAGNFPETGWVCEQQLAAMKARYDPPPFYEMEAARPTAELLPTSIVPIQRTPVQPLLNTEFITLGSWSPDGRFLLFSHFETTEGQLPTMLKFLNAETGEICSTEKRYPPEYNIHEKHVWLPDGQLLFISDDGIDILQPCQPGAEDIASRFPEKFTQVAASNQKGSLILLKNRDSFWIMDGNSLDVWPVPEVSPNPYELHWDQYAWSPDGKRLVISRLNGRDRKAGSTLYLINGETGELLESQSLEYASDQSAPGVEWLTTEEVLLHSSDILVIVNYSSEPPRVVDVREDLFALDFDYPNDIASWTSIVDPTRESYYLAVRLNQSGDKDLYLYRSDSGNVEIHHPTSNNTLLFFPGGEYTELSDMPSGIPEQDEFELIWVDRPAQAPRHIIVQGHIPRNYPHLFPKYLFQSSQLVFSSSQGISLVSVPDGETLKFWELNGAGSLDINLRVSPDEETLIAIVDGIELYHIPLQP